MYKIKFCDNSCNINSKNPINYLYEWNPIIIFMNGIYIRLTSTSPKQLFVSKEYK